MKEIFLMKLGEIVLKGSNKRQFESRLRQNVRRRMKPYGNVSAHWCINGIADLVQILASQTSA